MPIVVWPRLELPPAPYEKPADRRSVEPPEGEKKVAATIRKASAALRTVLQRSKIKVLKESRSDEAVPFVRATATVAQIRDMAGNKAVGAILLRRRQRGQ